MVSVIRVSVISESPTAVVSLGSWVAPGGVDSSFVQPTLRANRRMHARAMVWRNFIVRGDLVLLDCNEGRELISGWQKCNYGILGFPLADFQPLKGKFTLKIGVLVELSRRS